MDPAKNNNNHMPEPWRIRTDLPVPNIASESGLYVASIPAPQNAKRIVECVNAMEGIEDPMAYMQKRQEVKPVVVKLEAVFADSLQQLEAKMTEKLMYYRHDRERFEQLKEVIQSMLDRMDEGQTMTLTKDSVYVLALREALK